jgi:hypothetical protein
MNSPMIESGKQKINNRAKVIHPAVEILRWTLGGALDWQNGQRKPTTGRDCWS